MLGDMVTVLMLYFHYCILVTIGIVFLSMFITIVTITKKGKDGE